METFSVLFCWSWGSSPQCLREWKMTPKALQPGDRGRPWASRSPFGVGSDVFPDTLACGSENSLVYLESIILKYQPHKKFIIRRLWVLLFFLRLFFQAVLGF